MCTSDILRHAFDLKMVDPDNFIPFEKDVTHVLARNSATFGLCLEDNNLQVALK